jgi:hypothetical protein
VRKDERRGIFGGPGGMGADHGFVVAVRVNVVFRLLRTHNQTLPPTTMGRVDSKVRVLQRTPKAGPQLWV